MFSKHFSSDWILLVPTLSLLKYFDITLPRHKSSKIEGTGLPLMSHSIQFHCFCFHFSTVSKRETAYSRWHMKGVHVPSHLQSFAGVQFDFWEKFAKICKKSQKIDINRTIPQQIFRFLKFEFFGSTGKILSVRIDPYSQLFNNSTSLSIYEIIMIINIWNNNDKSKYNKLWHTWINKMNSKINCYFGFPPLVFYCVLFRVLVILVAC